MLPLNLSKLRVNGLDFLHQNHAFAFKHLPDLPRIMTAAKAILYCLEWAGVVCGARKLPKVVPLILDDCFASLAHGNAVTSTVTSPLLSGRSSMNAALLRSITR